jgi:hypothetical protein
MLKIMVSVKFFEHNPQKTENRRKISGNMAIKKDFGNIIKYKKNKE